MSASRQEKLHALEERLGYRDPLTSFFFPEVDFPSERVASPRPRGPQVITWTIIDGTAPRRGNGRIIDL